MHAASQPHYTIAYCLPAVRAVSRTWHGPRKRPQPAACPVAEPRPPVRIRRSRSVQHKQIGKPRQAGASWLQNGGSQQQHKDRQEPLHLAASSMHTSSMNPPMRTSLLYSKCAFRLVGSCDATSCTSGGNLRQNVRHPAPAFFSRLGQQQRRRRPSLPMLQLEPVTPWWWKTQYHACCRLQPSCAHLGKGGDV